MTETPSNELTPYTDPGRTATAIELAPPAWRLSQRIAGTEFVPAALRNRPEAVMACILYGREVGMGEMQALSKIHVVDGRPGLSAEAMRALVLQRGHEIWVEETTSTRCTIGGKRAGSNRETSVTWTKDDAQRAGLLGKNNWKKYPSDMLLARATAKLCRLIFADVIAGLSYTVEELTDGDALLGTPEAATGGGAPAEAAPRARPTARASKAAARRPAAPEPEVAPPTLRAVPALPGEEEAAPQAAPEAAEVIDAEVIDEEEGPPPSEKNYTGPQVIAIRLGEAGIKDRAERLGFVGLALGREVTTTKDLGPDEVTAVLALLDQALEDGTLNNAGAGEAPEAEAPASSTPPEDESTTEPPRAGSAPPRRSAPTTPDGDPETWDGNAWRTLLRARGLRVAGAVREAQRLAAADGAEGPKSVAEIAGSGVASKLLEWVEADQ